MATNRADIAKAMYAEVKEVFMDNIKTYPVEEYKAFTKEKTSTKKSEKYETIGNLKPASVKAEGDPVEYGTITDGHTTTLTNETIANGISFTMEATEDDQWGLVDKSKVSELSRTMMSQRELKAAAVWNGVASNVGADGVAHAADSHPLLNSAEVNDNKETGAISFDKWDTCVQKFNSWKNHYGEKFITKPSAALANINKQTYLMALLASNLKPFESTQTNTKNTIPQLKLIFGSYLSALPIHFIDETIDSAVFQRRKALTMQYDYDKRGTFNFYFNVHERYVCGMINPGFGFVTLTGE